MSLHPFQYVQVMCDNAYCRRVGYGKVADHIYWRYGGRPPKRYVDAPLGWRWAEDGYLYCDQCWY